MRAANALHGKAIAVRLASLAALVATLACACVTSPALALPSGRAYELVSPIFKGGFGATFIEGVREDGNAVAYYSPGAFGGEPAGFSEGLDSVRYLASRGAAGWSSVPLVPPDALSNEVVGAADFSPSLSQEFVQLTLANIEDPSKLSNRIEFFSHSLDAPDVSANWTPVGVTMQALNKGPQTVEYRGASSDFCHLFFNVTSLNPGAQLLPEAKGANQPLYELLSGCHGEPPELRLVALNDHQKLFSPGCGPELGSLANGESGQSTFHAIADDGNEIFFTTCIANNNNGRGQLFVRLAGTRTLEVSKPLAEACGKNEVPCKGAETRAGAVFEGASEDGSRVFFTSSAPLTGETEDSSRNLYMASIGCPGSEPECAVAGKVVTSLTGISRDASKGEAADVQGVVRIAPDGSRVYFIARGVLGEGPNVQGIAPIEGADNLYMYERDERHPDGRVVFVTDLCSGQNASGEVEDIHCPNAVGDASLWFGSTEPEAQTAGLAGQYLLFSSYGQLVSGDTDTAKDVYRYDAETGALERISDGEAGYHENGNDSHFDATIRGGHHGGPVAFQHELNSRAISEDGSTIIFTTSEPLSPGAINGLSNLYEWHQGPSENEGEVSLISGGSADQPVTDAVISPSGQDVFFATTQGLVPQDTDGLGDVYDARIAGGFPEAPVVRPTVLERRVSRAVDEPRTAARTRERLAGSR